MKKSEDYLCGECGYTDNKPGNCPNCFLPLVSPEEGWEEEKNPQKSAGSYSIEDMDSEEIPREPLRQQREKDEEDLEEDFLPITETNPEDLPE